MRQSAFGLLDSHTGWTGWEAAAHGPADSITIPDAHLLFSGDFKRVGTDLILSDDMQRFVVHDYFRGEHHPTLLSPEGARLSAGVVNALTGHGAYAQAAAAPNAVVAVGRVAKVEGSATIVRNGVAITINTGDAVLKGDVLQTGAGVLGVTFADGSTLSLTANSRLMVDDFVYDPNGSANSEILNLVQGSLSFISGEVSHSGGNMKITTPVATMGIRGTVGGITQASDGTVSFFVVESATGAVITDAAGHVIAQVVQNGPLIQVRATGPLEVVAAEIQKSPQELAAELAILQQIVSTQAVGQQLIQHFQDLQNNQGPHSNGTDHTQIQIDIPKSAFTDAGTGGATTNTQSASNTATVTTTTTDQHGTTTTTTDQVPYQNPAPADNGTTVQWTGASDDNAGNSANWDPNKAPTAADDVIIGTPQDENPAIVAANGPFAVHSLTLSDGALLQADDVTVGGNLAIFGDASTTELAGQSPLTIHSVGGDLFVKATAGDAEITACGDLSIGPVAGAFTVEAVVPAEQCASAAAEILAAGHDVTIGAIGGSFLLSATVEDGGNGSATAEISGANVTIGDVGRDFTVAGGADFWSPAFAEISATSGDVDIGNIVGDFLNQGLIDADNGMLSIGTVGGAFVNDGVMRAYELRIANGDATLDNNGKIIVSGGDDVGAVGVDLHNSGLFKVTDAALLDFNGGVHNDDYGTIVANDSGGIAFNDSVFNAGLIKASHDGEIDFNDGVQNFETIEATSYGSIHFGGDVDNRGTIEANVGGTIVFDNWVGGDGTLAMDGGTIELESGTGNTIDFSGDGGGALVLDPAAVDSVGQIYGFGPDDSIDFYGLGDLSIVGYSAEIGNTGRLELYSSSQGDFFLSFTGDGTNYTTANFVLSFVESGAVLTEQPAISYLGVDVADDSNDSNSTDVGGLSILEPFGGNDTLTITAIAGHGTLTALGDTSGLSFVDDDCDHPLDGSNGTLEGTGTLDAINAMLAGDIRYTPNSNISTDSVSLTISDSRGDTDAINFIFNVSANGNDVALQGVPDEKNVLFATGHNDTLTGNGSSDTFVFGTNEDGNDHIADFHTDSDFVEFKSSLFAPGETLAQILQSATSDGSNAVITLANNATITFDHVTVTQLQNIDQSHVILN